MNNVWLSCAASPVHIVGQSLPHISQPSKIVSLFPKPSEGKSLVLENLSSIQTVREDAAVQHPSASKTGKAGKSCLTMLDSRSTESVSSNPRQEC